MAQLKTMYKDAWESITGNCDTMLFLGGQEQTTLESVSKKLGKTTILTNGHTRSRGGQGSRSESENAKGRDLLSPDEISRLDNSECILFIRGLLPFRGKKYDYPKHPNYVLTGDANDDLLYKYRDPKRFAIPEAKKTVKRNKKTQTREKIRQTGKDAGNARGPESTAKKRRILQDAKGGKEVTPENLAKTMGMPIENATTEAVVENLDPIGGFVADFEFRGAENFHSDFLGEEEKKDNKPENKPENKTVEFENKKEKSEVSKEAEKPVTGKKVDSDDEAKKPATNEPASSDEPDELNVPDEFDIPEDIEESEGTDGVMSAGLNMPTTSFDEDTGDNGPQKTDDSNEDTEDDSDYSWS